MKSVISNHEATLNEVTTQIENVISVGVQRAKVVVGHTKIQEFRYGRSIYIITSINDSIVSFECENVYCFKF